MSVSLRRPRAACTRLSLLPCCALLATLPLPFVHAAADVSDYVNVSYKPEYIIASYLIACLGSATSLQVMKQRTGLRGLRNWLLLLGGSVALGLVAIWCMHFVGMMSVHLESADGEELRMAFEPGMTVGSLLVSIVIVAAGFVLAGEPATTKLWRTCGVGFIGGCGVSVMHYMGMFSMMCRAHIDWNAGVVVASVLVGVFAATAAFLIFFHLSHLWRKDWRLQAVIPLIMGLAVNGMHYTGMAAASWRDSHVEPVFQTYHASAMTLLWAVVAIAVTTSALLLSWSLWRMHMLRRIEQAKSASLTLAALVRDSQGRVLATLSETLPSVVIESSPGGSAHVGLHALSADFLRMLKISFQWPSVARYQRHLGKLAAEGQIPVSSLALFSAFIRAAGNLASMLGLPLESLGFLHWQPTGNMLVIMVRHNTATRDALQHSASGLRFAEVADVMQTMAEWQLPAGVDAREWLSELSDYQRRVLLPLCGESARDEAMDEFLREVCYELLPGAKEEGLSEHEVRAWRIALGRFVNTKQHLATLVRNRDRWAEVKNLDPMVKTQIELQLDMEQQANNNTRTTAAANATSKHTQGGHAGNGSQRHEDAHGNSAVPSAPVVGDSPVSAVSSPLYLGLLHVQVSATGLQVLLPRRGPLAMIPLVKLLRSHAVGSTELQWIREQLRKEENAKINSRKARHRQQQQQMQKKNTEHPHPPHPSPPPFPTLHPSPCASPVVDSPALSTVASPSHDAGALAHMQLNGTTAQQPSTPQQMSLPGAVPPSPTQAPAAAVCVSDGSLPSSPERGAIVVASCVESVGHMDTMPRCPSGQGAEGILITHVQPQPQQQQQQRDQREREHRRQRREGRTRRPVMATTDALLSFYSDLLRARDELSKLLGSDADLSSDHLWVDHLVVLSSDVSMILFLHCSMGRGLPAHYSPRDVQQVPLAIFDILNSAQHPSRTAPQWARRVLAVAMKSRKQQFGMEGGAGATGQAHAHTALAELDPVGFVSLLTGHSSNPFGDDEPSGSNPRAPRSHPGAAAAHAAMTRYSSDEMDREASDGDGDDRDGDSNTHSNITDGMQHTHTHYQYKQQGRSAHDGEGGHHEHGAWERQDPRRTRHDRAGGVGAVHDVWPAQSHSTAAGVPPNALSNGRLDRSGSDGDRVAGHSAHSPANGLLPVPSFYNSAAGSANNTGGRQTTHEPNKARTAHRDAMGNPGNGGVVVGVGHGSSRVPLYLSRAQPQSRDQGSPSSCVRAVVDQPRVHASGSSASVATTPPRKPTPTSGERAGVAATAGGGANPARGPSLSRQPSLHLGSFAAAAVGAAASSPLASGTASESVADCGSLCVPQPVCPVPAGVPPSSPQHGNAAGTAGAGAGAEAETSV